MLIQLFLTIRTYFHSLVGNLYIHENDNKSYHSTHPDGHLCWCVWTWDTHKPEWCSYCNPTWISPRIRDCFGDLIRHNPKKKKDKEKNDHVFCGHLISTSFWPTSAYILLAGGAWLTHNPLCRVIITIFGSDLILYIAFHTKQINIGGNLC